MIYLDHNSTTPVRPEVLEAMEPFWRGHFANPSSSSTLSRPVKKALVAAREQCAALLDCDPEELIFTSGATESLNTALHSVTIQQPQRRHLIIGATEHEAVLMPVQWLETQAGYEVTRLPVNEEGVISLTDLERAIQPGRTAAIFLMWANNETGVMHPVGAAAAIAAAHGIPLICDAVQAAGKTPVSLRQSGVQYAAFSGHKFHAPKGIGLLYVRAGFSYQALIRGGSQEHSRRAGTENPAAIVGIGAAAGLALADLKACRESATAANRDYFESEVMRRIPGSHRNGHLTSRINNTSSMRFERCQAEGLLLLLDQRGVMASAGSACTTGSLHPSHVLTAMGLDANAARSTLRFSLSHDTTRDELEKAINALEASVTKFRSLVA